LPERGFQDALAWKEWIRARDPEIRSRIERGAEDSISNLILYGTSYSSAQRIESPGGAISESGELSDLARARVRGHQSLQHCQQLRQCRVRCAPALCGRLCVRVALSLPFRLFQKDAEQAHRRMGDLRHHHLPNWIPRRDLRDDLPVVDLRSLHLLQLLGSPECGGCVPDFRPADQQLQQGQRNGERSLLVQSQRLRTGTQPGHSGMRGGTPSTGRASTTSTSPCTKTSGWLANRSTSNCASSSTTFSTTPSSRTTDSSA